MTPNPRVVDTALLARGPQIPLTDLVLRMAHDPAEWHTIRRLAGELS
jgi:hypothetical protein